MTIDRTDLLLDLINDAAPVAVFYVRGLSLEAFVADAKTRHAVSMCLVVIGENVSRLAKRQPEFIAAHPETPWGDAIGLRNRIAHGYEDLDFGVIWRTATVFLPRLLASLPASKPFDPDA